MDFTVLSSAVDFTAVQTAIGAIGAAVFAVLVSVKGYQLVKGVLNK